MSVLHGIESRRTRRAAYGDPALFVVIVPERCAATAPATGLALLRGFAVVHGAAAGTAGDRPVIFPDATGIGADTGAHHVLLCSGG